MSDVTVPVFSQQILTRAINDDLHGVGGTYIGSGLRMGINLLNTRRTKNPIAALLLLTDGQDNHSHYYGQLLSTLPTDVQCHTFGYGPDHLASSLVQIAEMGNNGSFTYIVSFSLVTSVQPIICFVPNRINKKQLVELLL